MIYQIHLKKLILVLLTIFTLQPLAAMESDGSKRQKTEVCEQQQPTVVPPPPAMSLAEELSCPAATAEELQLQPNKVILYLLGENLLKAAKDGNQAACSLAIRQGVDVNSQDNQTLNSPLIVAARHGHYNVCELLIKHRAKVDAQNRREETALMKAASNGHTEICELLIQHEAQVDAQGCGGDTALMKAAENGDKEICELLIKHRAQVDAQDNIGNPALFYAANQNNAEICQILLEHGANPNALRDDGTPVLIDSIRGSPPDDVHMNQCILTLLKHGADVNLLSNGKQIDSDNPQKNTGYTALMQAISNGVSRKICELLLQHGADHEYTNNQGTSAITLAHTRHTRAARRDEEGDDAVKILNLLTDQSEMHKAIINPKNAIFKRNLPGYFKEDTSSSQSYSFHEQDGEEEEEEQKESQGDSKSICLALEERTIGMKCRK